jgi:ubiquinol-cytochrome c reductase cytochrome c subunit
MRAVLTTSIAVAAILLAAGPAGASGSGRPTSSLAAYGDHLYGEYCLSCHGGDVAGTPGVAPSLRGVGALATDFYLRTGYMPLRGLGLQPRREPVLFGEHQIKALTAYVASFGGPPIPAPKPGRGNISQGQALFAEHCAGCHQIVAQGGYVTGAVPPALVQATPVQVAEAVRVGPYVMPRFSKRAIDDRELDSIVRYVEYTHAPDRPGGWGIGFLGPVPEGLVTWFLAIPVLLILCLLLGRRLGR